MNVLAISAHPDDETLGCGGTLLRHHAQGDTIHWAVTTQAHAPKWPQEVIQRKAAEVAAVAKAYSMASTHKLGMPTIRLDTVPLEEVIAGLRTVIEQVRPEVVYLPHFGDVHTDHHVVFQATFSVLKAFYMRTLGVRRVLSYETLSSTEAAAPQAYRAFVPNVYFDITPQMDRKIEIMSLFATECQPDPMPRGPSAIRALARYRGATVGVEYAEACMLVREVL
jgi:LmbE family N-acetylglucosaminyl deacetylase